MDVVKVPLTRRRNTIGWRSRLLPSSLTALSLASNPRPALIHALRVDSFTINFDIAGQPQLEQIGHAALFRFAHNRFIAKACVAAQQRRL